MEENFPGFPEVERGGNLRKHNVPLETSLFRPSCGFINHALQRRTTAGDRSDNTVPGKHLAPAPKNALIKPPATTSQHLAPSAQLEDTQVKVATGVIYQRCVCVCVYVWICARRIKIKASWRIK